MSNEPPSHPSADDAPPHRYTARLAGQVESRWQAYWRDHGTFKVPNPGDPGFDAARPKFFGLDMFPYPSGAGLHVGHPEGYTATDIICRYKRMNGFAVLHPMGWDAFGLPAEQYAIQTGVHPAVTTRKAIDTFRRQLQRFGFCYDWSREFATIDEGYYRWTQWIWLQAYHAWYDAEQRKARPIQELIDDLESGAAVVSPDGEIIRTGPVSHFTFLGGEPVGARKWHELTEDERREVLDSRRLAYLDEVTVNWCPKLGTVLANEEVIDGRSERGSYPVFRRPLRQWMFRITAFAERLLDGLATVEWPESTRTQQAEWIGRSEGAEIDFPLDDDRFPEFDSLRVFTTRPDTIFGATYMVVAPEHPLVDAVLEAAPKDVNIAALREYTEKARNRADVDRMAGADKEKTGVPLGLFCTNPASGERIPVWVADYVLMGYGHGAIMAVPAHDERDGAFAKAFNLRITQVVRPENGEIPEGCFADDGVAMNSASEHVSINGITTARAKAVVTDWLSASGIGRARITYRLRDWLFSRQRYWGEPFPIVYDEYGRHHPVDAAALPVKLPELTDYQPIESDDPTPLLGKATDWVNTTAGKAGVSPDVLPPDARVRRETNTMPGWAGSCWYYLRFCDPQNESAPWSAEAERYWMGGAGADLYIGGNEHAVLHLLYARFWHKILFDLGHVSTDEPFKKLFHQGLITSFSYERPDKTLVPTDLVEEVREGEFIEKATGQRLTQVVAKMSKSLKNVVNPDDVIAEYGADTFRLYEMSMGPLEASKPWNTRDIIGSFRFLQRLWRNFVDEQSGALAVAADEPSTDVLRALHKTIAGVRKDIEALAFNTAIAKLIEFNNLLTKQANDNRRPSRSVAEAFVRLVAPFAPHIAEELWCRLGHGRTLADEAFPVADERLAADDSIEVPVSVMGKVRSKVTVAANADAKVLEAAALADPRIAELLAGKTIKKVIVVPGRMVNVVHG